MWYLKHIWEGKGVLTQATIMDGPRGHHAECSKPATKGQAPCDPTYMRSLEQPDLETENRREGARGWGRGCGVSVSWGRGVNFAG